MINQADLAKNRMRIEVYSTYTLQKYIYFYHTYWYVIQYSLQERTRKTKFTSTSENHNTDLTRLSGISLAVASL